MLILAALIATAMSGTPREGVLDTAARTDLSGRPDSVAVVDAPSGGSGHAAIVASTIAAAPESDTVPRRRRAVVYSEAYGTRLALHRHASYAMLPLFAAQYLLGQQLIHQKDDLFAGTRTVPVDAGLRHTHAGVAIGVAALFALNTTTGLWNLYEARDDPRGRGLRTAHALTMLAADAGFVAVGMLGSRTVDSAPVDARRHRDVALGAMAVSTAGAAMMWFFNR